MFNVQCSIIKYYCHCTINGIYGKKVTKKLRKKSYKVTKFKARKSIINCDYMSSDKFEKLHEMVKSMTAAQLTELLILFCAKS